VLTDNWNLNLCRFEILNAGVSSETGTEIAVSRGWDHAGAHIGPPIGKERIVGGVETITIDDALQSRLGKIPPRLFLKLDVEGAEIAALHGAKVALQQDCLICYEDHVRDWNSPVSDYVLNGLGWRVFFIEPEAGKSVPIPDLAAVKQIKTANRIARKGGGINFFACRSESAFFPVMESLR
jgi:FkbM family methyltransferase